MVRTLHAPSALLPDGWGRNVAIDIDEAGTITAVRAGRGPNGSEPTGGPVIPGMANVHSHAFQRAMAGMAERMGSPDDSFWTWREVMYSFIRRLDPRQLEVIATQLYIELLRQGYTGVAEFHYLHRDPGGRAYTDPAEAALAHVRAARAAGIALTVLPSLYAWSNFGDVPPEPAQRRFVTTPAELLRMVERLRRELPANPVLRVGAAPHSLRAVNPAMLRDLLAGMDAMDPGAPVHIHLAEQVKEVNDCLSWGEKRPVQWLLDNVKVDARWCLVHCTHSMTSELEKLAASGAVVGLCPTTGANLGDGIFPFGRYRERGGRWGIGSDSHVSQTPVEELRWLEYVQRLGARRRNIAASPALPSVGATLWREAGAGGAQALGRRSGAIAPGLRADLVVLDHEHINLVGRDGDQLLDAMLFAGNDCVVRHVMVGGRWVVRDGTHDLQEQAAARYREVRRELTD